MTAVPHQDLPPMPKTHIPHDLSSWMHQCHQELRECPRIWRGVGIDIVVEQCCGADGRAHRCNGSLKGTERSRESRCGLRVVRVGEASHARAHREFPRGCFFRRRAVGSSQRRRHVVRRTEARHDEDTLHATGVDRH